MKNLVILGSTGSIGKSTLEVVDNHPGSFKIIALTAHSNAELLIQQYNKYKPDYICITDAKKAVLLKDSLKNESVKILIGEDELLDLTSISSVDMVVNAIVGSAGLRASLQTIKNNKDLALANKESLVAGGPLFASLIEKHQCKILPIDSEHSAIWQALRAGEANEVKKIIITASGGPFRTFSKEQLESVTLADALNHPTWNMGRKITIDSATLANKGLEVIEAVNLFHVSIDKVGVVVHPQSIIHSLVEYIDSSMIAQLSNPDMKLPISYALFWPQRVESSFGELNLAELGQMTFEKPDYEKFPALKIAFEVALAGGTAPAVFNAANEEAVDAFINGEIGFNIITDIIKNCVDNLEVISKPDLDDILSLDQKARTYAQQMIGKVIC
ncbi:MAG: 1-deoxy-D-xylulose-5-phosphate reductoisomerase [Candidatus Zixiibacteriota bacterium]|nr:MAG: 1-deoxy-D-xylulose-5-phosphate reductoisomerase [candidate division Zixibacteria bacterium]